MSELINVLERLTQSLAELGFKLLESHFKQVINNLKNIFSDRCCIFPSMLNTFLQTLDSECDKIKKQQLDKDPKIFKKDKRPAQLLSSSKVPNMDKTSEAKAILSKITQLKETVETKDKINFLSINNNGFTGNPLSLYGNKPNYSPTKMSPDNREQSHSATVEKEVYPKVRPVAFNGLFKKVYANSEDITNELNKYIRQDKEKEKKEGKGKFFRRGASSDSNIFEYYPFKQEKINFSCVIF